MPTGCYLVSNHERLRDDEPPRSIRPVPILSRPQAMTALLLLPFAGIRLLLCRLFHTGSFFPNA